MELLAPSRWRCVDCISDLHLQASEPLTFSLWQDYLTSTCADAVFILGDLFEVWVGDDVLTQDKGFESQCVDVLRQASARMDIYIMHGNRDFLMGQALMQACNATLLADPTVFSFGPERWLLTHGDALCLDDTDYMQFRAQVRSPQWQQDFLSRPLQDRLAFARGLRTQSEARKHTGVTYADVDHAAANEWLQRLGADQMIHGHTHRPGQHALGAGRKRVVLSDWDGGAQPPRAEVLRLSLTDSTDMPVRVERISPASAARLAD
ncbi:UDP-2,3-diacylglucosamine diphosphatase [Rhodoferax saidenbachensis]|uniref:UDP-2,3-diacylglucosamine hydrolase n=1 Tax=Rhodoferax saidenbachensis TaxID=1484693 RepID=A0A1P8KB31_9BURK|nr:UDP-2,3-diacylglucosamine diphosphatase [Rhodoferax saidenbachensis]APW43219.1 UDP-2,3-diacylglucosamine hydrolase [Rhodoferax saidenbachensis]